jgi:hypothetical protein
LAWRSVSHLLPLQSHSASRSTLHPHPMIWATLHPHPVPQVAAAGRIAIVQAPVLRKARRNFNAINRATGTSTDRNGEQTFQLRRLIKIILPPRCGAFRLSVYDTTANAKDCAKGAATGGVAGHVAGHHGAIGAAVGCAIGHHERIRTVLRPKSERKPSYRVLLKGGGTCFSFFPAHSTKRHAGDQRIARQRL